MPRERDKLEEDAAWLMDMLTAARAVQSFVAGRTFEQYQGDLLLRSGVERQVEIIGEAARGDCPTRSKTRTRKSHGVRSWLNDIGWHTSTVKSMTR